VIYFTTNDWALRIELGCAFGKFAFFNIRTNLSENKPLTKNQMLKNNKNLTKLKKIFEK